VNCAASVTPGVLGGGSSETHRARRRGEGVVCSSRHKIFRGADRSCWGVMDEPDLDDAFRTPTASSEDRFSWAVINGPLDINVSGI
jgi:hypothetical protein